ncbi:MAG: DUF177 domain-containing protein [Oscillospiraceae bacterium]|jgi:uncharacterized protein|nr:DUF177 domain-containing protein [Oscillospiraceae bacterium]
MLLDLKGLFSASLPKIALDCLIDLDENPIKSPVRVSGEFVSRPASVFLSCALDYVLAANCDRCAEYFENPGRLLIEQTIVTEPANEDADFIVCENQELDLTELVRSEIILNLPPKLLCREDCKGVCPGCGANLNREECACARSETDPRLEKLRLLLKKE